MVMEELEKATRRRQTMAQLEMGYCLAGIKEVMEEAGQMRQEIGEDFLELCRSKSVADRKRGLKARTMYIIECDRIETGRGPLERFVKKQAKKI